MASPSDMASRVKKADETFNKIEDQMLAAAAEDIQEKLDAPVPEKPSDDAIRKMWREYFRLSDERAALISEGTPEDQLEKPIRPQWAKPEFKASDRLTQRPFVNPQLQRLKKELKA